MHGGRPLASCPSGATLTDFGKASRHGCLLAQMQQMLRVSRTRRRTCWLILSWPAGARRASPSSPHLVRGKGGALGTADGDGKLLDHPQLGGRLPSGKNGLLNLDVESLSGAAYGNVRPTELISTTPTALAHDPGYASRRHPQAEGGRYNVR